MKSNKKDPSQGNILTGRELPETSMEPTGSPAAAIAHEARQLMEGGTEQAVARVSHDGRILQANHRFYENFKLTAKEKDQNLLHDLLPADRRLLERKLLLAHHSKNTCQAKLQNKEAKSTLWQISACDGILLLQEMLPDLPSKALAPQTAAPHIPAVSSPLLEIIPLPGLLYNQKHEVLMVNQRYTDFIGRSHFEATASHSAEGFLLEYSQQLTALRKELFAGRKEIKCQLQLSLSNGEKRWVEYTETVLSGAGPLNSQQGFSIAVLYDLTAFKQQEEVLESRQEEVDMFMDRASHDLKGPLKSMMGLYGIMEYEFGRDATVMEYIRHYHKGISRLYRIVEDMLQLSRINKGEQQISRVNLHQMVDECLQAFKNLPRFYEIRFTLKLDVPAEVLLEESLLQTIIQNLLENAIKYCAENEPEVQVLIKEEQQGILLVVSDNGIGIPADMQPRVFDRYFRATQQASGSGLGLYLLKQAVNKLKGQVELESHEGKGTTFRVYIPYAF